MELFLELLLEFFIQIVGEILFELGLHSLKNPALNPPNPWFTALPYSLCGALFGGISLWPFPHHMVAGTVWRNANLIVTPIIAGLSMSCLGAWRARRGQSIFPIDRFAYGYLFALSFALVRLFFGK